MAASRRRSISASVNSGSGFGVMDTDQLFLARCRQVVSLHVSHNQVDLVDLAARLRQLLYDHPRSLVHTVNAGRDKIKLVFRVGDFQPLPSGLPVPIVRLSADGIDPDSSRPGKTVLTLSLANFLNHAAMSIHAETITIKEIIELARSVEGGVHYNPSPNRKNQARMAELNRIIHLAGIPSVLHSLRPIARVTLRGLDPLIAKVEARSAPST